MKQKTLIFSLFLSFNLILCSETHARNSTVVGGVFEMLPNSSQQVATHPQLRVLGMLRDAPLRGFTRFSASIGVPVDWKYRESDVGIVLIAPDGYNKISFFRGESNGSTAEEIAKQFADLTDGGIVQEDETDEGIWWFDNNTGTETISIFSIANGKEFWLITETIIPEGDEELLKIFNELFYSLSWYVRDANGRQITEKRTNPLTAYREELKREFGINNLR